MRTVLTLAVLFCCSASLLASDRLVVHEWGTFTSLQDESGRTIGGVNVDDEPLPEFVHRLGRPRPGDNSWDLLISKSLYPGAPSVTMRLETPVIYFYPPDDKPMSLDVTATFHGGVLSEFFPDAETMLDGKATRRSPESVRAETRGSITWKNVQLNSALAVPETDSHVWLAPRQVAAAPVQVGAEAEKYLFYRGAAHVDAPLTVRRNDDTQISISAADGFTSRAQWLADFRADGSAAFRQVSVGDHSADFADTDYSTDNLARLRAVMKQALISDGLFADEAEAMLETWKLSYFKTRGQRLFFMVPQTWTDQVLPLEISVPAEITRVMIGRIELVTPDQRPIVQHLTAEESKSLSKEARQELLARLGRFGNVLVSDAHRQRQRELKGAPTAALITETLGQIAEPAAQ